ncbi:MAG: TolA-binding protein [Paracoccaceae bacterium]
MSTSSSTESIPAGVNLLIEQLGSLSHGSILLLFCALTLAAVSLRCVQIRLAATARREAERTVRMSKLQTESNAQAALLEQYQERLQTLEGYVDLLNGKQQQQLSNGSARKLRLQEAIDFAGRGLGGQEIARRAGVNGSEARLIGELYGINAA